MSANASNLTVHVRPGRGGCLISLEGVIDETFESGRLLNAARGVAIVDLDKVRRITSFGVREWVKAMRMLAADYLGFVNCRPAVVTQFNTVANFAGRGELLSFYAPYLCSQCGKEHEQLIDVRRQYEEVSSYSAPGVTCEACKAPAELDDLPENYFTFAASASIPNPPPLADGILSGSALLGVAFRVDKEVQGTITALWLAGDLDRSASLKRLADGLEGEVVVLMHKVGQINAEGLSRLRAFVEAVQAQLWLCRVPLSVLRALLASAGTLGRARVVSVNLPFRCEKCRSDSVLELAEAGVSAEHRCPVCAESLQPMFTMQEARALVAGLPWGTPPQAVADYLSTDPSEPSRSPGEGTDAGGGQVFGRYQLIRPIGAGGMAQVFLARQTGVGGFEKNVVLKRILPNLSSDERFVAMFLHEARVAARISHPNVVQIFDVGQVGSQYYIAMEYVRGWDLNAILRLCTRLNRPFPVEMAIRVVADICAGLHEAHTCLDEAGRSLSIVHRDVSPHNVLISTTGQVKVTDFGIAKAVDTSNQTPTAILKGKLSYMSPEQVRPEGGPVDGRSDVFSAGLILYQCVTLEHVFRRESEFATFKAILYDPVPRMSTRRPEVGVELEAILDRALARNLDGRYPTAADFQQDLEWYLASRNKAPTAAELAAWLKQAVGEAEALGQLPPEMSFTPTQLQTPSRPAKESETVPVIVSPKLV